MGKEQKQQIADIERAQINPEIPKTDSGGETEFRLKEYLALDGRKGLDSAEQKAYGRELEEYQAAVEAAVNAGDGTQTDGAIGAIRELAGNISKKGVDAGDLFKLADMLQEDPRIQALPREFSEAELPEDVLEITGDPHEAFERARQAREGGNFVVALTRECADLITRAGGLRPDSRSAKAVRILAVAVAAGFVFGSKTVNQIAYAGEIDEEKSDEGDDDFEASEITDSEHEKETGEGPDLHFLSRKELNQMSDSWIEKYAEAETESEKQKLQQELAQIFIQQNRELMEKVTPGVENIQVIELGFKRGGEVVNEKFTIVYMMGPKDKEGDHEVTCYVKDGKTERVVKYEFNTDEIEYDADDGKDKDKRQGEIDKKKEQAITLAEMKSGIRSYIQKLSGPEQGKIMPIPQEEGKIIIQAMIDVMKENTEALADNENGNELDSNKYRNVLKEIHQRAMSVREKTGVSYFKAILMRHEAENVLSEHDINMEERPMYLPGGNRQLALDSLAPLVDVASGEEKEQYLKDVARVGLLGNERTIQTIINSESEITKFTEQLPGAGGRFTVVAYYTPKTRELNVRLTDSGQKDAAEFKFKMDAFIR